MNRVQFLHHFFTGLGYTGLKTFGRRPVSNETETGCKPVKEVNLMKRVLRIGALVLAGFLVIGAVAAWALPADAAAASRARRGAGPGASVVDPVKAAGGTAVADAVSAVLMQNLIPGDLSDAERARSLFPILPTNGDLTTSGPTVSNLFLRGTARRLPAATMPFSHRTHLLTRFPCLFTINLVPAG
jgi:hypothetical protein